MPHSDSPLLDPKKLPRHLAIIMDGNGRWAKSRSLPRIAGHRQGVESVREVVRTCREIGIKFLTLYAFSQENWQRPPGEVNALMGLLSDYLEKELAEMLTNGISLRAIGEIKKIPRPVYEVLLRTIKQTESNQDMVLTLALSYSGRDEIVRAVREIARRVKQGILLPDEISEEYISQALDTATAGLPDPDFLIRTSGEYRISNFLLWQMAYTENYITDVLWPDFRKEDLIRSLLDYQERERRFGLTSEQVKGGYAAP
ncbi:MAG: isoprenyl transferase [Thermodesulfobacteriota bacterium]|nr:isoprenyl transferase [Thermodesulfobacteriota bacterium]